MRHHNTNRKFGRFRNQRKALLRSLAISLIEHEVIKTTEARAKELRPYIEKIVTKGKNDSVWSRRLLNSKLGSGGESSVKKIIEVISPRYKDRQGGYTRITKLETRQGDGSLTVQIEFV